MSWVPRWPLGAQVGDRSWFCSLQGEDFSPRWLWGIPGLGFLHGSHQDQELLSLCCPCCGHHVTVPAALSQPCLAQVWLRKQKLLQTFAVPSVFPRGSTQSRKGELFPGCLEGTGREGAPGDTRIPLNFNFLTLAALPTAGFPSFLFSFNNTRGIFLPFSWCLCSGGFAEDPRRSWRRNPLLPQPSGNFGNSPHLWCWSWVASPPS